MKKHCPFCKCSAKFTNKLEYYAKHLLAYVAAYVVTRPWMRLMKGGHYVELSVKKVYQDLSINVKKHYKCTNPACLHEWNE